MRNKRRHARPEPNGGPGVESMERDTRVRRRQVTVRRREAMGATMDPPVALGPDIMMKILESSDACSVARRTLVSLRWHEIAASDFLWAQKTAPEYWQNLDPSSMGTGPPIHSYFQPNGSQEADPDDKVWGGHECT